MTRLPSAAKTGQPPSSPAGAAPASLLAGGQEDSAADHAAGRLVGLGNYLVAKNTTDMMTAAMTTPSKVALAVIFVLQGIQTDGVVGSNSSPHFLHSSLLTTLSFLVSDYSSSGGVESIGSGSGVDSEAINCPSFPSCSGSWIC